MPVEGVGEKPPHPAGPLLLGVGRPVRPLRPRAREAPGKPPEGGEGGSSRYTSHFPPGLAQPARAGSHTLRWQLPGGPGGSLQPLREGSRWSSWSRRAGVEGPQSGPRHSREGLTLSQRPSEGPSGPTCAGRVLCPSLGAESPQAWETRGQDGA